MSSSRAVSGTVVVVVVVLVVDVVVVVVVVVVLVVAFGRNDVVVVGAGTVESCSGESALDSSRVTRAATRHLICSASSGRKTPMINTALTSTASAISRREGFEYIEMSEQEMYLALH